MSLMFKVTDVVEVGYFSNDCKGGSVDISIYCNQKYYSEELKQQILQIIDKFDHCLITDNDEIIGHCKRYFKVKLSNTIFDTIMEILTELISYNNIPAQKVEITLNETTFIYDII